MRLHPRNGDDVLGACAIARRAADLSLEDFDGFLVQFVGSAGQFGLHEPD